MKTLYVRVAVKNVERFNRAGHTFTRAWLRLTNVDEATARRLAEEQMLEVSEQEPEGFEPTAEGGSPLQQAAPVGGTTLERTIIDIVGTQLSTSTIDAIFDAISSHFELDRRADREEAGREIKVRLAEIDQLQADLTAAREALASVSAEFSDTKTRLANALDDQAHLVQAYEALKRIVDKPVEAAQDNAAATDVAIDKVDAVLDKLKAAVEPAPDDTAKPKKAGK